MCYEDKEWVPECSILQLDSSKKLCHQRMRRSRVRVHRFIRSREREAKSGKDMEEKNLKLYLENKCIMEENNQLKKKALLLHQENLALLLALQKKP